MQAWSYGFKSKYGFALLTYPLWSKKYSLVHFLTYFIKLIPTFFFSEGQKLWLCVSKTYCDPDGLTLQDPVRTYHVLHASECQTGSRITQAKPFSTTSPLLNPLWQHWKSQQGSELQSTSRRSMLFLIKSLISTSLIVPKEPQSVHSNRQTRAHLESQPTPMRIAHYFVHRRQR